MTRLTKVIFFLLFYLAAAVSNAAWIGDGDWKNLAKSTSTVVMYDANHHGVMHRTSDGGALLATTLRFQFINSGHIYQTVYQEVQIPCFLQTIYAYDVGLEVTVSDGIGAPQFGGNYQLPLNGNNGMISSLKDLCNTFTESKNQNSNGKINVSINAGGFISNDEAYITGTTNLPDGLTFIVTASGTQNHPYINQISSSVKNGKISVGPFKNIPKGRIKFLIGFALMQGYPKNIQSIVGQSGANLYGQDVVSAYGGKTVEKTIFIDSH